ncbi:unnamed protein product, partial [Amoebophrya sp. A120]
NEPEAESPVSLATTVALSVLQKNYHISLTLMCCLIMSNVQKWLHKHDSAASSSTHELIRHLPNLPLPTNFPNSNNSLLWLSETAREKHAWTWWSPYDESEPLMYQYFAETETTDSSQKAAGDEPRYQR